MSAWNRRGAAAAALAVALGAACGGQGDALRATTASLDEVTSGTLTMRYVFATGEDEVGFALDGPFSVAGDGPLATADITYRQLRPESAGPAPELRIVSTGTEAFAVVDEVGYALPEEQAASLRLTAEGDAPLAGFEELRLDEWVQEPVVERDAAAGADVVTGTVRPGPALGDVFALASAFGAGQPGVAEIDEEQAAALAEKVTSSEFRLVTGAEDRRLRELHLAVELADPRATAAGSVRITFDLGLADPGAQVTVQAPTEVRPYEELAAGG